MPTLAPKLPWQHPFAGGYPGRSGQYLPVDADATDYLSRLAEADGASVEVGIAQAIDAFVRGCKADNAGYAGDPTRSNWDAIQASCIMCGARTLSGALVPLKTPYGSELVNIDALPTPTIFDQYGSTGGWVAETRTLTSTTVGTSASFPRFTFQLGMTVGKRYRAVIKFSGDLSILYGARIAPGSYLQPTGVAGEYAITAAAGWSYMEIDLACNVTTGSVRIESLSIREDSFTPTALGSWASGDYSRSGSTPGLKGNGTTKYLNTNRANNADGTEDHHLAVYKTLAGDAADRAYAGSLDNNSLGKYTIVGEGGAYTRSSSLVTSWDATPYTGTLAVARTAGSNVSYFGPSGLGSVSSGVAPPDGNTDTYVFARSGGSGVATGYSDARLAFYSVGSSLSLSALDERVTNLVTAIKFHSLTGLLPNDYDVDTISYIVAAIEAGGTL